jgi:transposase
MHHRDFRGLTEDAQAEVRRQAFRNLDKGMSRAAVAEIAEVNPQTVGDWCRRKKEFEDRDYYGAKRGRAPDEQKLLQPKDERKIKKIIETKTPDKAGLQFALWTRKAISALAKKRCAVTLTSRTVSKYTKRWGFTPQRPAKVAREQDPAALKRWRDEEFPAIIKRAVNESAEIQWEDETGVSLATFYARSYAPKGKTPTIRLSAKRASLSMISSISHRGDLRFMLYNGGLNADIFLVFLKRLVRDTPKKIFLICDNLSVHKAKTVRAWEKEHRDKIELFFPASV